MKILSSIRGVRSRIAVGLLAATIGLPILLSTAIAQADACFGGGTHPDERKGSGGADGGVSQNGLGKWSVGMGLVTVASLSIAWLALRRSDEVKNDD